MSARNGSGRLGEKMSKTNFLGIYGRAHKQALTPENIKSSFRAMGVWPLDPSVITPAMMAASKETSCEAHLPIAPTMPVRVIAKLLQKLAVTEDIEEQVADGSSNESTDSADAGDGEVDGCPIGHDPKTTLARKEGPTVSSPAAAINKAIKQLLEGSLASLVSSSTMTSSTAVHHNTNQLVSPTKSRIPEALRTVPKTMAEIFLLGALRESKAHAADLKLHVLELQAANILNEAYCSRLRGQLAHKEEKQANPKGKGKLMGSGLPCLLSGDWFYERVVEFEAHQREEECKKAARVESREERGEVLTRWKEKQEERKVVIAAR